MSGAQAPGGRRRVLVLGPLLGREGRGVPTQAEQLIDVLRVKGCSVVDASAATSAPRRFVEMSVAALRYARWADAVIVMIYSGRSFVVQDVVSAISRLFGAAMIMHLHGGGLPAFAVRYPRWTRRVLARAAVRVAPSAYMHKLMSDLALDAEVIPNMVPLALYPFRCRRTAAPRLLWMRAFEPLYDPQLAIRTLHLVKGVYPEATLTMAGPDHGALAGCVSLAARLELGGSVAFPGMLDTPGKLRALADADILLNTTRIDNAPVSLLEACASGVPIVSTAAGGIPDMLVPGCDALLVPADAELLAAAVCRVVAEPRLSEQLSRRGRAVAEAASTERCGEMWLALLDGVMRARRIEQFR